MKTGISNISHNNLPSNNSYYAKHAGGGFNTLVQSSTAIHQNKKRQSVKVAGKGANSADQKTLKKWAKRKIITIVLVLNLVDVARRKGNIEQVQKYWNTYHCLTKLYESGNRLHGDYCKNRICSLCCAIRKAELINKYLPILSNWNGCYFVTLTIKAIPAKKLTRYVKGLLKVFAQIIQKYRKRNERGNGIRLQGIRSLECNFNAKTRTYNPHFHIIVRTKRMAEILHQEWIKRFARKHVYHGAQHMRKVENMERDLVELIKYGSKIFTEPDLQQKSKKKISHYVYVSALHNILTAMNRRRIFDRFGFNLTPKIKVNQVRTLFNWDNWVYKSKLCDWVNLETGEMLSGYNLGKDLMLILRHNIDTRTE